MEICNPVWNPETGLYECNVRAQDLKRLFATFYNPIKANAYKQALIFEYSIRPVIEYDMDIE